MSNTVPEGWAESKLGSIAKLTMGQSPSSDTYNDQGVGLPFFQGKADFGSRTPKVRYWCSQSSKVAEANSILFSVRAPVGEVNLTPYECCIGRGLAGIKAESADQEYLFQKLQFEKPQFGLLSQGSTFEAVNGSEMREFPLVIPPLPEQQKIAAILSSVDDVIEKTRAQIDKLKDLKTGMMQELLTKGIGHTAFKDSPVGRIPEGWEVVRLTDAITVKHGFQFREDHFSDVGLPVVKIGNLTWGGQVDMARYSKVPQSRFPEFESYLLTGGEILMALTGATLGKVSIYDSNFPSLQNYRVGNFIPNKAQAVTKDFTFCILQSGYVQLRIEELVNEAAQPNIGKADLESMYIPVPPMWEQIKITGALFSLFRKTESSEKKLRRFRLLKNALMQDLLTGKVRVNVDNKETAVA